jgi:hypothetical protein
MEQELGRVGDADRVLPALPTEPVPVSAHSGDAPSRDRFVGFIADRFQERHATPLPRGEAEQMARDCLDAFLDMDKIEFGDGSYDWEDDGAHAIADEEIFAGWESAE